jgi:hypothetical protein
MSKTPRRDAELQRPTLRASACVRCRESGVRRVIDGGITILYVADHARAETSCSPQLVPPFIGGTTRCWRFEEIAAATGRAAQRTKIAVYLARK